MAISFINHGLTLDTIPNYVSARTKNGLRRAMLRNNTRHKGIVIYQDIQWDPQDKKWIAWFYVRAEDELLTGTGGD